MTEFGVAGIATLVEPSAAASTAAGLAGFLKSAALATRAQGSSGGRNGVARRDGGVFARGMGLAGFLDVFSRRALHFPGEIAAVRKILTVGIGARCGGFEASRLTRPTHGRGCGCCRIFKCHVFPRWALNFLGAFARVGLQAAGGHGVFEECAPEVTTLALGIRGNSADAFGELARRALFVGNTRAIGTTCRRRRHTALKGVWTTKA